MLCQEFRHSLPRRHMQRCKPHLSRIPRRSRLLELRLSVLRRHRHRSHPRRIFARRPVTVASSALYNEGPASRHRRSSCAGSSTIYRMPTPTTPAVAVSAAPASLIRCEPWVHDCLARAIGCGRLVGRFAANFCKHLSPDDRISILAFICKPLPKTPDPDPSLNWSGKA